MADILGGVIKLLFGTKSDKDAKAVLPIVEKIKVAYTRLAPLTNDQIRAASQDLMNRITLAIKDDEAKISEKREELKNQNSNDKENIVLEIDKLEKSINETIKRVMEEILPEAFALMKETARRFTENEVVEVTATQFDRDLAAKKDFVTIESDKAYYKNNWTAGGNVIKWDMVHYDSQLFGGVVLHNGKIAEMATGEGKTLVSTLPIFLNALSKKGVHVVTVNDYLARRDSEWMGPMFQFHGLSVDCIDLHTPNSDERRNAYNADITYGTNNEFGFDYLRDNMASSKDELVQRNHQYAIVDEVDSVLIDDARTPLIISGPVPKGDDQMFDQYKSGIERLFKLQTALASQFLSSAKKLIAEGKEEEGGVALLKSHKALPKSTPLIKYLSDPENRKLLMKTEGKYMENNYKRMPEITQDLYFVIDEKLHSADLMDNGHDMMSKDFGDPKFFILPDVGEEIANIEKIELPLEEKQARKDALLNEYSIKTERVHTVNQLLKAYSLFEREIEYVVIDNKVKIVDEQTGRIMEGRRYSDGLHQAIEAKENVNIEAATQTVASITLQNYFRMYNKLAGMTGTAETEAAEFWNIYKLDVVVIPTNRPVIRDDRSDVIYKTKREKYAAAIAEIETLMKAGRPVLVGTTSVEVSELISKMLTTRNIPHNVLNAKQHQREAQIVREAGRKSQITIATNMAGRGTDIKLSDEVKSSGGLAIIGTERHESRRVDRQLRGRAGRQGDPGSSQFFISFEDDLMRLFGSDKISGLVDKIGMKDGDTIQSGIINSAISRAQKRVEENNFGIRKRLLEYDNPMNIQRTNLYQRRNNVLDEGRIDIEVKEMIKDYSYDFIQQNQDIDFNEFKLELVRELSVDLPEKITEDNYKKISSDDMAKEISDHIYSTYKRKIESIAKTAYPVLKSVYDQHGSNISMIGVPFTDGIKGFNIRIDIKKAVESEGYEVFREFSKLMLLMVIDDNWKEHLRNMDDLKQGVQSASYEQKDPLLIFKLESSGLFTEMNKNINREAISLLIKSNIPMREGVPEKVNERQRNVTDISKLQTSRREIGANAGEEKEKPQPIKVEKKAGRNDPCPCGSGKKYKHCHGAS